VNRTTVIAGKLLHGVESSRLKTILKGNDMVDPQHFHQDLKRLKFKAFQKTQRFKSTEKDPRSISVHRHPYDAERLS